MLVRHFPFSRDGRVLVTYGGGGAATAGGVDGSGSGAQTGRLDHANPRKQEQEEEPSVKFLMLNPAVHFDEIVGKVWWVL